MELCNILEMPGGYDVAWDYCLENNICIPAGIVYVSRTERGTDDVSMGPHQTSQVDADYSVSNKSLESWPLRHRSSVDVVVSSRNERSLYSMSGSPGVYQAYSRSSSWQICSILILIDYPQN